VDRERVAQTPIDCGPCQKTPQRSKVGRKSSASFRDGSDFLRTIAPNQYVVRSNASLVESCSTRVPVVESYWKPRFPGQIDSTLLIADELKDCVLELEGEQLISIPLGHTDTDSTTCLHVPSIGLAVCGDALYNDVHLHLGESNAEGPNEWIAALDTIESLKPVAAIAGHKRPGAPDTPDNIEATRKYIRDFDRFGSHTKTAVELYKQMLTLYPERINPAVLWNSSIAIKPVG
jgi:glyoxylase-like metal-dependent hydrolase (beta-lactamase superfamily II)